MSDGESFDQAVAIARELKEQLKFYRDIGFADIGGSSGNVEMATSASSRVAPLETTTGSSSTREAEVPENESLPQPAAPLSHSGLFGEIFPPGEQPAPRRGGARIPVVEARDLSLETIRDDLGDCQRCKLCEHRRTIVFGEGNPGAQLAFVGEGPGAEEDATGRPFVGRAGQLLDKIIAAIGLARQDVYIANIVKCRPPGNRTPERDEVETCEPFLFRQLAFIRPRVIVALGSPAFQCLLRTREPISRARGDWREWNGIKVMPTFHPAFLLRSPDKKREVWEDMKKVRDYLNLG